jgi:hypothetical protein
VWRIHGIDPRRCPSCGGRMPVVGLRLPEDGLLLPAVAPGAGRSSRDAAQGPGWPDHRLILRHRSCPSVSKMNNRPKESGLEVGWKKGIAQGLRRRTRCFHKSRDGIPGVSPGAILAGHWAC